MSRFLLLAALCVALSGCATNQSTLAQNAALYYPNCYLPLQQARQLDSRARDVATGAGKGLLAGTLAGLAGGAISALFTGDPLNIVSGAAIGAAGGAVAGGVTGGMQNNTAQKEALMAQWSEDAGTNLNYMGFNGAAATWSLQCYNSRLKELQEEVKAGIVPQAVADPRFQEIALGQQEATALLNASRP